MDSSFAITGKGYVIVAADMTASRSIVKMQSNEDKIKVLGSHLLMAYSGEPGKQFSPLSLPRLFTYSGPFPFERSTGYTGDTVQFAEYVERNIRLAQIRNTYPLPPPSAASWIRRELADSLRSRSPYAVNLLVAGTISLLMSRNCTGSIIWGRWLLCRSLLTDMGVISP
jgi:20S proteasome subunit beta 4